MNAENSHKENPYEVDNKASRTNTFTSPILKDLNPSEWHFYGLWKQDLFSSCFWVSWANAQELKKLGLDVDKTGVMVLYGGHFFRKESVFSDIQNQVHEKMISRDHVFCKKIKTEAQKTYTEAIDFAARSKELGVSPESFEKIVSHARAITLYWGLVAIYLTVVVENELSDQVAKHSILPEHVPHLLPRIRTSLSHQKEEALVLKKEVGNHSFDQVLQDAALKKKLEAHRKRYAWIEIANWIGEELTLKRLFDLIKNVQDEPRIEPSPIRIPKELAIFFLVHGSGRVCQTSRSRTPCDVCPTRQTFLAKSFQTAQCTISATDATLA